MSTKISPRSARWAGLLTSAALLLMLMAPAGLQASKGPKTHATTGSATHLRGSTGLLTGLVYPAGAEASYYFQYGATTAYGSQTPTVAAGSGTTKVAVGQPIAGLAPTVTYHYRIVALSAGLTLPGRDRTFVAGGTAKTRLVFRLAKPAVTVFGTPFLINGTLSGLGSANAPIALQASPYPYLEPFVNVGAPGTTNAAGAFSFRISNLALNTQFRVITLTKLPIYSPTVTEQVALNVTLRTSLTRRAGFVRLYGFVTPAKQGARVFLQLEKAVRPNGKSENATRFVTEFTTTLKRGGKTFSRFSAIVGIRHAGRYRAMVKLEKGPLASGGSKGIVIRGTVPKGKKRRHGR